MLIISIERSMRMDDKESNMKTTNTALIVTSPNLYFFKSIPYFIKAVATPQPNKTDNMFLDAKK